MLLHWKVNKRDPPLVTVSRTSIRFPLFIGNGTETPNTTTYFMRCENPPLCWLKLLLLLLLLLLKLNLALLASKPPFPGNSYGYCARILHFSATPPEGTFWLGLPITLQATQFKAAAIHSQINMKAVWFHKEILFEAKILIAADCS